MADQFQYDVFLSHSSKDKLRVRRQAEGLREAGLRVWFDEWVIQPGDDIYLAVERGLEASRTLLLCMSPNTFGSDWVGLERSTVLFRDPSNAGRRFIPLLLDDCNLPDTLRRFKHIDLRQEDAAAFEELLSACRPAKTETAGAPAASLGSNTGSDLAQTIRLLSFSSSIRRDGRRYFRCELRLEAANVGSQSFGWSGLSICIPTIDTKNLYWDTEFETNAKGSEGGPIYGPGDPVWCLHSDGRWERSPAKYVLIETVINFWEPRSSIDVRAALRIPCSPIHVGLRAWALYAREDWTGTVIRDPLWNSPERRDQQGIPAYWHSIGLWHTME